MKILCMKHVPFEKPGNVETWAGTRGHSFDIIEMNENIKLPMIDEYDMFVIMGGPMNVYEENKYPWLTEEKKYLKEIIRNKKHLIGICLGAQLIADAYGSRVYPNKYKEIGWFNIRKTAGSGLLKHFPDEITAFHWHGDMFDIPENAVRLFESDACGNQGFVIDRSLGLQFHLEMTEETLSGMLENCFDDITAGEYVQNEKDIISSGVNIASMKKNLYLMLDSFVRNDFQIG